MIKKIPLRQVRLGMYLHDLGGTWLSHPFWRPAFVIDDLKDLQQLQGSGLAEIWIDTEKGLDVEAVPEPTAAIARPSAPMPTSVKLRVSVEDELNRAAKICAKAHKEVTQMFQQARLGRALDASNAMPLVEEISQSVLRNPEALIGLARLKTKDDYTYMHSVAVCALMVSLARQIGLDEEQTRNAGFAGLLHDIGKMAVPDKILNKPGTLTVEEYQVVQSHPVAGHDMLRQGMGVSEIAIEVCLHHHEKIDGSGYPHKLAGESITVFSRMGAICDVYDALTSNRPYKDGWCPAEAVRRMAEWHGHFDQKIFQAFVKSVGIYPIGTLVKLESGRLAVVVEQSEKSLLAPKVKAFFSTKSGTYIPPEILTLSAAGLQDRIVGREDAAKWSLHDINDLWAKAD